VPRKLKRSKDLFTIDSSWSTFRRAWLYRLSYLSLLFGSGFAHAINELNENFADQEFIDYFSQAFQQKREQAEQRLETLAAHLNLTPEQQPAWNKLKLTLLEQVENRVKRRQQLRQLKQTQESFTTQQMLQLRQSHMKIRLKETRQTQQVVDVLYPLLNQEQQTLFDKSMTEWWLAGPRLKRHLMH